jgi:signal transduction histidine kinase
VQKLTTPVLAVVSMVVAFLISHTVVDLDLTESLAQTFNFSLFGMVILIGHRRKTHALNKLEDAYKAAIRAAGAKDDFMAVMSHELRTPLTAIMGYIELMIDGCAGKCNPQQQEWLERVDVSSKHLLTLIEQVLDICRAEKGKLECQIERTDAGDLVRRTTTILKPLADKKKVQFYVNVPKDRVIVETDISKLRQVIVNLVSNAIKFTEQGSITVELSVTSQTLRLTVRDTGCGIADAELEHIYEPFYQGGVNPYNRSKDGAGLGLTITRDILMLLGGTISVDTEVRKGSIFLVTLPRVAEVALVA